MESAVQSAVKCVPQGSQPATLDIQCRVCELETENARLRLLVGELLVTNQRLRDGARAARVD
jgi:hypothetical protein